MDLWTRSRYVGPVLCAAVAAAERGVEEEEDLARNMMNQSARGPRVSRSKGRLAGGGGSSLPLLPAGAPPSTGCLMSLK